jgi:outer membrane protein assembly factor BamB
MAVDTRSGEILWMLSNSSTAEVFPTTLCVKEDRVFYQNPEEIVCLDAETGERIWGARRPVKRKRLGWSTPTLVVYGRVVFSADRDSEGKEIKKGKEIEWETVQEEIDDEKVTWIPSSFGGNSPPGELIAYSVQNGEMLWSCECREGYNAPVDVLIADSLLWTGNLVRKTQPGFTKGRDPETGKINKEREPDQKYYNIGMNHHRCYRNKATNRYLITSRAGVEFVDIRSGEVIPNHWVRGSCHYGILPCNGLLYAPPHPCACYSRAKLNGLNALTHELRGPSIKDDMDKRINKEPMYGRVLSFDTIISSNEWPTYRHDSKRSGYTQSTVPVDLKKRWEKKLGGKLSSVVISEGKVFVSSIEEHTVYALNKENGNIEWQYTAGGRVDSPPTVYRGLCIFGAADGRVYCLRSSDGKLVWSFRASPSNRRVVSYGQLESAWPINGSVLVEDSTVYFSAGRSSFLEEGVYLYRLDPATGQPLSKNWIKNSYPETPEEQKSIIKNKSILVGALPDVLSSDGEFIYMRHMRFNKNIKDQRTGLPHLFSSTGFLDDSWWHRSYWVLDADMLQGFGGWKTVGNIAPSGRILNFDDSFVYGFGRDVYAVHGSHVGVDASNLLSYRPKKHKPETYYRLFRTGWDTKRNEVKQNHYWTKIIPLLIRAMVLTENALIIAGPPDGSNLENLHSALNSSKGGLLYLVSPSTGEKMSELKLDSPPVFDGMAVADRKVYMSSLDGRIFCFGE